MKMLVLGCDGGRTVGYDNTALLLNDTILIDAGTIQSQIGIEEALKITDIFLTHSHLDHIVDLPFLLDATFQRRTSPIILHGTKPTLDAVMEHIFNFKIWPDFSGLPVGGDGQFILDYITPDNSYKVGDITFTPIEVNHTVPTVGYKIEDKNNTIIFSSDTGPVENLWNVANNSSNLKAVIIDLSFPIEEQDIADLSKHMTATDIEQQLKKLTQDCDIYTFHHKVGMSDLLEDQSKHILHRGKHLKALRNYSHLNF